ncbi:MAG: UvrD-helicase domain-containing protein [Desulfovibrio sp.]|jgi:uncharacterized protein (TIGR00375 family)|nr:UvrD-helicase domain-containing protein [Desulfovibrio sp.]
MTFIADLHIHSRFSRATSKDITVRALAQGARDKGIDVLGSGDFTHPEWRAELRSGLCPDETSGLYRLAEDDAPGPLFCLQAEISSIYKARGKVRKVHNLIFAPSLDDAERISARLARLGNLKADGRPILGLDCRDLLELTLEAAPRAVLIPAHIWTPWFSLFGSKSGFDRLQDCFGDLSSHIFALETGLSSDPAMNRRVSALDGYALVSNSDAHSPANLGREANLFSGRPSYDGIFEALRAAAARRPPDPACAFLGTLEFCPEEGKYHLDGHRACNVVLTPQESEKLKNICPVCGKPLTVGVLHRVLELADRDRAPDDLPLEPLARPVIPLAELISEILGVGPQSNRVQERRAHIVRDLGPELHVLSLIPEQDIRTRWDTLGEAIARMRRGDIIRRGGYDGEYGSARVFSADDLRRLRGGPSLFVVPSGADGCSQPPGNAKPAAPALGTAPGPSLPAKSAAEHSALSDEQRAAFTAQGPALVLAGPGAGKTRLLVARLLWLLERGEEPGRIVALTFTRRAARELRERLAAALPHARPRCDTMHGLAFGILKQRDPTVALLPEDEAFSLFREANPACSRREQKALWENIAVAAETCRPPAPEAALCAERYARRKKTLGVLDYQDLLAFLARDYLPSLPPGEAPRHVLVDEVQDLSPLQLGIVRNMSPPDGSGFFAIGDPDQAIYGFRGAAAGCGDALRAFWPDLRCLRLGRSFRAGQEVLALAQTLLRGRGQCGTLTAARPLPCRLDSFSAPDDKAEAKVVARRIARLLGGSSHTLLDGSVGDDETLSPASVAVLVRLKAQMPLLRAALEREGIPCIAPALEDVPPEDATGEEKAASAGLQGAPQPDWLREAERASLKAERVQILTLHASKGLEFEAVFLPGLEDGILPLRRDVLFGKADQNASGAEQDVDASGRKAECNEDCDEDEERRLLYVGLTRAARRIFLSRADSRLLYGRTLKLPPSPFLEDIKKLCRESALVAHRRAAAKHLSLFS